MEIPDTFPGIHSVKTGPSISAANTICDTHTHTHTLPVSHTLQLAVHQGPCQIAELFQGLTAVWEAQVTIHASPQNSQAKWCVTPAWKRGKTLMEPGLLHLETRERETQEQKDRERETWKPGKR